MIYFIKLQLTLFFNIMEDIDMLKKVSAFILLITGCIMLVAMSIFLIYYSIYQKQPIDDNVLLIYLLYMIFIIFIVVGFAIIDDVEKKDKDK